MTPIDEIPIELRGKFMEFVYKAKGKGLRFSARGIFYPAYFELMLEGKMVEAKRKYATELPRWSVEQDPSLAGFFKTRVSRMRS